MIILGIHFYVSYSGCLVFIIFVFVDRFSSDNEYSNSGMFVIGLIYSNGSLGRNFVVDRLVEIYFGIISIVCVVGLTLLLLLAVIVVVSI